MVKRRVKNLTLPLYTVTTSVFFYLCIYWQINESSESSDLMALYKIVFNFNLKYK